MQTLLARLKYVTAFFKQVLLHGLLTILPFSLTIGLFMISFRLIIRWLQPIEAFFHHPIQFLTTIPYATIANQVALLVVTIFCFGLIMRTLLLQRLIHYIEQLLFKLPLVRPIYSGIKQLIHAFSFNDKVTFKKVVIVEFPHTGVYSLGFLTSELPTSITPTVGQRFYNVFIPTTPNPTTGFFVMLPEGSFKTSALTPQEAMAMIISGGIILPERFML
jgi:uncharacterized membrane protein